MKVGDLVRWSDVNVAYHLISDIAPSGLVALRCRGIILDKNTHHFFVLWENGEFLAQPETDLEVISESR